MFKWRNGVIFSLRFSLIERRFNWVRFAMGLKSVIRLLVSRRSSKIVRLLRTDMFRIWLYSRSNHRNPVRFSSGVISETWFSAKLSRCKVVRFASGEISEIWFSRSDKVWRWTKSDSGVKSLIWLLSPAKSCKLVTCSKPVRSLIPLFNASKCERCFRCSLVSGVWSGSPISARSVSLIAVRKFRSGIQTSAKSGRVRIVTLIKTKTTKQFLNFIRISFIFFCEVSFCISY